MPIITNFTLPPSQDALTLPPDSNSAFFIAFLASRDPSTGQPWCPDVRASLPHLTAAFSGDTAPQVAFVDVGQRDEWKNPSNIYRTDWKVSGVPTLVRYERVDGRVKDVGRISEVEILDKKQFSTFIKSQASL
ncbi:uncharacterized protein TRUGW13939_08926 [Talaromyces rugulosus]|uniref:Thioredoxin domain-containing protein n=1 Tax=Talaromyces rugulosus TaxID=121627 RepID=A0A7H8R5X1_TALRU|nr:uncharacterized protein TRUGW13939_08926 [Talaromyces rugulosus]QKX61770.1 hypothetical protein TRUGW13939_08926 [Talaromyces rugulosus]